MPEKTEHLAEKGINAKGFHTRAAAEEWVRSDSEV